MCPEQNYFLSFRATSHLDYLKVALVVKNSPANGRDAKDVGSIPRSGRSPGVGNGNSLQYSCLENPMNRGAWRLQSTGSQKVRRD